MILLGTAADTLAFGQALGRTLKAGDAIALSGQLGAGKTVLARGMLNALGHHGDVPSPSFPLVIQYDLPAVRLPLAHVDLYRIDDAGRIDELDLDGARAFGAVVVEWPERFGDRGWHDMLGLSLSVSADGTRALTATVPPAWEARWPPQ